MGKITFIDLAGSESLNEIGVDLQRYKEGMQINESLICLGGLIRQAALNTKPNYDLHLLTQLMQDALGDNSKTLLIACISPSKYDIAQTRQTLDYAMTTGSIKNKSTTVGLEIVIKKEEKQRVIEEKKRVIEEKQRLRREME